MAGPTSVGASEPVGGTSFGGNLGGYYGGGSFTGSLGGDLGGLGGGSTSTSQPNSVPIMTAQPNYVPSLPQTPKDIYMASPQGYGNQSYGDFLTYMQAVQGPPSGPKFGSYRAAKENQLLPPTTNWGMPGYAGGTLPQGTITPYIPGGGGIYAAP